eukprot:m.164715 g.164715  ORF g.164715 m.164715 type:complete len:340 (-) comp14409_c0_seq1:1519-2538(-)
MEAGHPVINSPAADAATGGRGAEGDHITHSIQHHPLHCALATQTLLLRHLEDVQEQVGKGPSRVVDQELQAPTTKTTAVNPLTGNAVTGGTASQTFRDVVMQHLPLISDDSIAAPTVGGRAVLAKVCQEVNAISTRFKALAGQQAATADGHSISSIPIDLAALDFPDYNQFSKSSLHFLPLAPFAASELAEGKSTSSTKPFKCLLCQRDFARDDLIHFHMSVHNGSSMLDCHYKECTERFATLAELKAHHANHLTRSSSRPVPNPKSRSTRSTRRSGRTEEVDMVTHCRCGNSNDYDHSVGCCTSDECPCVLRGVVCVACSCRTCRNKRPKARSAPAVA